MAYRIYSGYSDIEFIFDGTNLLVVMVLKLFLLFVKEQTRHLQVCMCQLALLWKKVVAK